MKPRYESDDIKVLRDVKHIRRRPSMYIGDVGKRGLHHLIWEVVDNSVDEALAGFCKNVTVEHNANGTITVKDDGRGIPVDFHSEEKKSALELVMTIAGAGGKFDDKSYSAVGGLHGVGAAVVNALSRKLIVTVKRAGKKYRQSYERGIPLGEVEEIGKSKSNGTSITFLPDSSVFGEIEFDNELISGRLRELAYLNRELKIVFKHDGESDVFESDGGVNDFVKYLNRNEAVLHEPIYMKKEQDGVVVEIAVQYNRSEHENVLSFVNNIRTIEGGTHLSAFRATLSRVVCAVAKDSAVMKKVNVSGEDLKEGLTTVVSLRVPEPQFEGQTKTKLGNKEVGTIVTAISGEFLKSFFEENPGVSKLILEKVKRAAEAREAARRARELVRKQNKGSDFSLLSKLTDCRSKDIESNELILIEGDSAAGTAKYARDKKFQAVLPLKGKVLNVERANVAKMLKNEELSMLIQAIGGVGNFGDEFDIEKVKYGKILIMCDADADGAHIETLLLTFFYRQMNQLIQNGMVYVAQPPLFFVKVGKFSDYVQDEKGLSVLLGKLAKKSGCSVDEYRKKTGSKLMIKRFKGLGEMNTEELEETSMLPGLRVIQRVEINDAAKASEMFSTLMGDKVLPRREFIMKYGKEVIVEV